MITLMGNNDGTTELRIDGRVVCVGSFSSIADLANRLEMPVCVEEDKDCGMVPDFLIDVFR